MISRPAQDGFTLVEALVAMAILAIAATGLVGAVQAHIDLVRGVQTRTIAQWVAENRLVELGLTGSAPIARKEQVRMLDRDWDVDVGVGVSEDPDLALVSVSVTPARLRSPRVTLTGFVDTGSGGAVL